MSPKDSFGPPDVETMLRRPDEGARSAPADRADGILERLASEDRLQVFAAGRKQRYEAGEFLFEQGENHDGIVLILNGRVRSYYVSPRGRIITLAYWPAGHFVGAPQILGGGVHMWTSVAVAATEGLKVGGRAMERLVRAMPDLAVALIQGLVHKSQCYTAMLQMVGTESKTVRLAHLIMTLVKPGAPGAGGPLVQEFTQEELASMIGATRQAVSLALDRFEKDGMIERDGLSIRVVDPAGLRRVCS